MGTMILAATSSKSGSGGYFFIFLIVGVLALMYFMTIRPQRARQRAAMQTQRELSLGAWVRTTAGIYGTVTSVDGQDVTLEVAPGVEIRLLRRAIMEVISDGTGGAFGTRSAGGAGADDPETDDPAEDDYEAGDEAEDSHQAGDGYQAGDSHRAEPAGDAEAARADGASNDSAAGTVKKSKSAGGAGT